MGVAMNLRTDDRSAGVILHPTSLPGPYGIGDLGQAAHAWVDLLANSSTGLWQVLPLGPTGYADSPYQCFSSFAGNANLISPEALVDDDLLDGSDLLGEQWPPGAVDYGRVIPWKRKLFEVAFQRHRAGAGGPALAAELESFRRSQAWWLDEFALFMALKEHYGGGPWIDWPRELRLRDTAALAAAREQLRDAIERQIFSQFLFFRQWSTLKQHAAARNVRLIGDIPMFVAADSADVWSRLDLFRLDDEGHPTVVAGVPPDYFSPTGQLWGNPLYDWERHAAEDFDWWARRLGATLDLVDIVRIDHFRAFADYWEIPADADTAVDGRWLDGPGIQFFDAMNRRLGDVPVIAEDLGDLSPAVPALLKRVGYPGMRILQFAFDSDAKNEFLPHHYPIRCVAYTGTHDNDTTLGWWKSAPRAEVAFAERYLDFDGTDPVGVFLDTLWGSAAMFALAPLQDLLRLDSSGRMNVPGTTAGNWQWRVRADAASEALAEQLRDLNRRHNRVARVAAP
jgi:4-alpha-glucanotransferase